MTAIDQPRTLLTAGLIGLLALCSAATWAAPATPGRSQRIDRARQLIRTITTDDEIREEADITDEQVAQIEEITLEAQRQGIEIGAAAQLAQLELQQLWGADELDGEAIHEAINAQLEILAEQRHAQADTRLRIHDIIDDEQREVIIDIMRERAQERREQMPMRGQRGFRPGGPGMGGGPGAGGFGTGGPGGAACPNPDGPGAGGRGGPPQPLFN